MHVGLPARELLAGGLAAIREQFDVPAGFPAEVEQEAAEAAHADHRADHRDLTAVEFVTLDPASATDLDQAFFVEQVGSDIVLHYAIADVAAFVRPGGPLDTEAWRRGATIYLPDSKVGVYPAVLSEGAASLLPDGPRPAIVLTVRVDGDGEPTLSGVERAMIRSRAKLAYESVSAAQLPPPLEELARRVEAAEDRRGAPRVEFPEQEVEPDPDRPGCLTLRLRPRAVSEDRNATMSLAANLAVASALHAAHTGVFRVMPDPDRGERRVLRQQAKALGIDWPDSMGLRQLLPRLDVDNPQHARIVMAIRRAGGGASYEAYRDGPPPWHSAMAATYAHATAPLRRLADRYVLLGALAVHAGEPVPAAVQDAFRNLPKAMSRAENRAALVERAAIDLVEAVTLHGRENEEFDAVVIDVGERGAKVQLLDPPVVATVDIPNAEPGARVRVRLRAARPEQRSVEFTVVGTLRRP